MKKIITLLIAAGAFASVNAQSTKDEARKVILGGDKKTGSDNTTRGRDVILGGDNGTTRYPGSSTSKQAEIDRVNREYDAKIISIRNNPNLSTEEKDRIIRDLENQRKREIKKINGRYDGDDNDRKTHKNKKAKSDNGKHLGWEKGKGNPHKNGGTPGKGKGKGRKG